MLEEATELIHSHGDWLKSNTLVTHWGEYVEIALPFLDRHNDHIQIYLTTEDDGYVLSDYGETLDGLGMQGIEIATPRRKRTLHSAIVGFGVCNEDGVLKVRTSRDKFGCDMNNLVQAILSVNDLHFLAKPISTGNFGVNVVRWLRENFAQFDESKKIVGKSGLGHSFHCAVTEDRKNSKQVFKAISSPTTEAARNLVFSWIDTREQHFPDAQAIAILNDRHQEIPSRINDVLSRYEISSLLWSERNDALDKVLVKSSS